MAPTSNEAGGYNNWYWYGTVWDGGANAWRADINISNFNNTSSNYLTHIYVYDNAENQGTKYDLGVIYIEGNKAPKFTGTPTVARVANSNTSLTITATATDANGDNLTYTLCDSNGKAISGVALQTKPAGQSVTFRHDGLGNFSTHTYIVKVSDGKAAQVQSTKCSGTTYCKGGSCSGSLEPTKKCGMCNGKGKVNTCLNCWKINPFRNDCPTGLNGSHRVFYIDCSNCKGTRIHRRIRLWTRNLQRALFLWIAWKRRHTVPLKICHN